MMRGYWGQPDDEADCFWHRPSPGGHPDRFYRTGDLVRVNADGEYVFAGRRDRQVKSRGHRIELDEVQAAIAAEAGIAEVAVYDVPDGEGSRALIAALSLEAGHSWNQPDLVRRLRARLPAYAVPTRFAVLQKLPRTSAGKVDWQTLRATDVVGRGLSAPPCPTCRRSRREGVVNRYEEQLRRFIVDELLSGDADLTPDDSILADGVLDSVGVMRLVAFIDEQFDYQVPAQDLTIEHFRTTQSLAAYLERQLRGAGEA